MSKFQIGLLVVFGVFVALAVFLFARSRGGNVASINLTVWGSVSEFDFENMLRASGLASNDSLSIKYIEKPADKISSQFTEALAEGKGPDLIILSAENLIENKNKLIIIPPESVKTADYLNTFIKEGELFVTSGGTYALPIYVDPMVLYWNKELLAKATLATPPVYWDQIYDYIKGLTQKDGAGNISQTALALGEAKNIPHAKEVLSLLILQAGGSVVENAVSGQRSALLEGTSQGQLPAVSALEFFTQFANPQKSFYSWNRSLMPADTHFTAGKSAMYLGFASELPVLKAKNPTLDLGIAPVPQSRVSGKAATFGRIYGVAISRGAKDRAGALTGAVALASKDAVKALASATPLIPARRDLLSEKPADPAGYVFYGAALLSKGWLDPNATETRKIFTDMIESVTSGRARVEEALGQANTSLNSLLQK